MDAGRWRSALATLTLALAAVAGPGCEPGRDAELLRVERVRPAWVEPGTRVRIDGEGFPAGRRAAVRFRGTVHRPGDEPLRVAVKTGAHVLSDERVVFEASPRWVSEMGDRGTFEGTVRVELDAADGMGTVSGALPGARLNLTPATATRLSTEVRLTRRAETWLERVGLAVQEDGTGEGLRVRAVEAGGASAAVGLREGDRIVRARGVRPVAVGDLAPAPDSTSVKLTVRRADRFEPFHVRLPGSVPPPQWPSALAWVLAFVVAVMGSIGPVARPVSRAVHAAGRALAGPFVPSRARASSAAYVALVLVIAGMVVMAPAAGPVVAAVGYLACVMAAVWLRPVSSGRRMVAGAFVVVGAVCVDIILPSPTGTWLVGWPPALTHPLRFVALLCAARAAFPSPGPAHGHAAARWLELTGRAAAAVLLAATFLWRPEPPNGALVPFAACTAQALALSGVATAVLRGHGPPPLFFSLALLPGLTASAVAWAWLDTPPWAAVVWTPAILTLVAGVVVAALARGVCHRLGRRPGSPLRLHPFL